MAVREGQGGVNLNSQEGRRGVACGRTSGVTVTVGKRHSQRGTRESDRECG